MKRLTAKQYARGLLDTYTPADRSQHQPIIRNFFEALLRRHAMKLFPRILSHIQTAQDTAAGVTRVRAWSASKIDQPALSKTLEKAIGPVSLETETDPTLIGGLRLQIGDTLIDGTLRNRLNRLQTKVSESA